MKELKTERDGSIVSRRHLLMPIWHTLALMTVYVHFNRFIELTINPHTNLYNLASRKPRLLRAWDPLVPYNYCFWSPWLWDVSLAEEMNLEGWGVFCSRRRPVWNLEA